MFRLGFGPAFARQKEALLAEKAIPSVLLPPVVEQCLSMFGAAEMPGKAGARALWRESIRAIRPLLLKATLISFLSSLFAAASTLAATQILQAGPDLRLMLILSFVYFLMSCLTQIAVFQSGKLRCWVGLGVETHLVSLVSRKLLRLSAAAAARQSGGNLKTLITSDVRYVGQFLDNVVRNLIPALAALVVIGPLLVYFTGRAGLFGLLVMAMIVPLSVVLNSVSSRFQAKSQGRLDDLTSLSGEWVKNIRLIRYLSWDDAFRFDVSATLRRFMTVSAIQHFIACLIYGLSISWWMVAATGVVLASRWLNLPLDLVGFFGSLWLLTFLAGYYNHLPNTIRLYGLAAPSVRRIARLLAEEEQSDYLKPGEEIDPAAMPVRLVLDNVSLRYDSGRIAIDGLSMDIPLRSRLAIIGEIGSGKTTLLKLLCGELPPTEGRILVEFDNGQLRDLWTRAGYEAMRKHIAYVPQEPFVSSDLLHVNISLAADAPHDDIIEAAYWAELEADLSALPEGVSQELGEGGVNLSGGQRQRLNLARAFFSRRHYMVLDDTLSAVDNKTETALMDRLIARGKGFVLVTHRTGELLRVDEVAVMKDGRVVERGDPKNLAAQPASHFTRVLRAYELGDAVYG
jgi:ABC-type multidrug transport system fused ATPase/permease subunit